MYEEEYDPLLEVADQGYTPDTYILDSLKQAYKAYNDKLLTSMRVVKGDIGQIKPEEGVMIYNTTDGQLYYGASNVWNVIN